MFLFFHRENFDDESPFHPDTSNPDNKSTENDNSSEALNIKCDKFQELTAESFAQLIKEVKVM